MFNNNNFVGRALFEDPVDGLARRADQMELQQQTEADRLVAQCFNAIKNTMREAKRLERRQKLDPFHENKSCISKRYTKPQLTAIVREALERIAQTHSPNKDRCMEAVRQRAHVLNLKI